MYEYLLSAVLILLSLIFLHWKRGIQSKMEHFIGHIATKFIENMLDQVREKIVTSGYEHWKLDLYQKEFALPDMFKCHLTIKNLLFTGASKFVINKVSYDVTTSKANFDISVPKLHLAVGDVATGASVSPFGMNFKAQVKGWVQLLEPRIVGAVGLEINNEGKVVATSLDVYVQLKGVKSKVNLSVFDSDYSEAVNTFVREKLAECINTSVNASKGAIEAALISILNPILAQMF